MNDSDLLAKDAELRAEADRLLASGLRRALDDYGDIHIVGSYALRLMAWRDLDIHVVRPAIDQRGFFELGARIADVLSPARMHFRNELVMQTPGLPRGLYWGVYLGDERTGAWKIDVWTSDDAGFRAVERFAERLRGALTDDVRAAILRIKAAVWDHPQYRRSFSATDIYSAVVDEGVRDVDGFTAYLAARPRV
jgi:hypothetical protein